MHRFGAPCLASECGRSVLRHIDCTKRLFLSHNMTVILSHACSVLLLFLLLLLLILNFTAVQAHDMSLEMKQLSHKTTMLDCSNKRTESPGMCFPFKVGFVCLFSRKQKHMEKETKETIAGQKWVPKRSCPGKWNQGLKPVVPWWFNFDPHPIEVHHVLWGVLPRKPCPPLWHLQPQPQMAPPRLTQLPIPCCLFESDPLTNLYFGGPCYFAKITLKRMPRSLAAWHG